MLAVEWAQRALTLGPPETDLVTKPLEFSVLPRLLIAKALRQMGQTREASTVASDLLASCFGHPYAKATQL